MILRISSLLATLYYLCSTAFLQGVESEKIVIFAPPKTGTHLVGKLISNMTELEGHYHLCELGNTKNALELARNAANSGGFAIAHNWNKKTLSTLAKEGYKILFTMRDPRDQTVSMQDWFHEGQWNWMKASKISDKNLQLEEMITGKRYGWTSASMIFKRYKDIKHLVPKHCYIVKYENLVGPMGGGTRSQQVQEITKLATFLHLQLSTETIEELADTLYGDTRTFRKGQVGRWKQRFTDRHKKLFNEKYRTQLKQFSYSE